MLFAQMKILLLLLALLLLVVVDIYVLVLFINVTHSGTVNVVSKMISFPRLLLFSLCVRGFSFDTP